MNIRRALTYVQKHGDALAKARAEALLAWTPPPAEVVARLEQLQSPTGGWPAGLEAGAPPGIAGTAAVLFALLDLGLQSHPLAQRGVAFLQAQQEEDGGWPVDEALPYPSWPGEGGLPDEAMRFYTTAMVSSLLVAYGQAEGAAADRALDLLLNNQLEGGLFPGFPRHTAWYALPLLAKRLGQRSGPAQNILLTLSTGLADGDWSPFMLAAMLRSLLLAGFGMETPLARQAWEQLLMRQRDDGAWEGQSGPEDDLRSTMEVLWCWRQVVVQR